MSFKYYVQRSHHDHSESEEYFGSSAEILTLFDEFDWDGEVEKANKLGKCAPTISIEASGEKLIWVSGAGRRGSLEFVSDYSYPGIQKFLFGLIKREGIASVDARSFSRNQAREALSLFMQGNHDKLLALY